MSGQLVGTVFLAIAAVLYAARHAGAMMFIALCASVAPSS